MAKICIMRGLPGSGKSTRAKALQGPQLKDYTTNQKKRPVIVSSDEYFTVGGTYYFDPMKLGSAHRWSQWKVRQLINAGRDVILDNTNLQWKEMKSYIVNALEAGYEVEIVEPDTDWAWNIDKLIEKGSHGVPRDTYESMMARYEPLADILVKLEKQKEKYK